MALTPFEVRPPWREMVCIVIDVICASSTIVTLLDKGCPRVFTVRAVAEARALAQERGFLIGGERNGLVLPGFDFDNSPFKLQEMDVQGRDAVLTTTNGTRVIKRVETSRAVLIGSFLNAAACCHSALNLACQYSTGIGLACAGTKGRFALDDALCAGCLIETLLQIGKQGNQSLTLSDSAKAAKSLFRAYPDIGSGFLESSSGRRLVEIQRTEDIVSCSMVNVSEIVPILIKSDPYRFEDLSKKSIKRRIDLWPENQA
ncbi:MAG TPA: 2-phosphosulfolactate phosphatase [Syntrophomonadaceae bacterium]|nr:2-phosphosulfolactate phosphatase [Syntrophomonadaceae bacterium]